MMASLHEQLKNLITTCIEQGGNLDDCIDQILGICSTANTLRNNENDRGNQRSRSSSIFDGDMPLAYALGGRRRSSTYSGNGLVNNPNTVLYDNRDIDWQYCLFFFYCKTYSTFNNQEMTPFWYEKNFNFDFWCDCEFELADDFLIWENHFS